MNKPEATLVPIKCWPIFFSLTSSPIGSILLDGCNCVCSGLLFQRRMRSKHPIGFFPAQSSTSFQQPKHLDIPIRCFVMFVFSAIAKACLLQRYRQDYVAFVKQGQSLSHDETWNWLWVFQPDNNIPLVSYSSSKDGDSEPAPVAWGC